MWHESDSVLFLILGLTPEGVRYTSIKYTNATVKGRKIGLKGDGSPTVVVNVLPFYSNQELPRVSNLSKVVKFITKNGGHANRRTGGHIHTSRYSIMMSLRMILRTISMYTAYDNLASVNVGRG